MLPPHDMVRQLESSDRAAELRANSLRRGLSSVGLLRGLRVQVGFVLIRLGTALAGCEWIERQRQSRRSLHTVSASRGSR